jgi:response regulator of citrate/malate metabolism
VLVVEDDREVAGVNCRLVSRLPGLTVVGVAATADQAREMVSTQQPRLILLDLGLPGASGISLLRRSAAPVEVIAVTAAASTTVVRAALHLGVIDYLVKPFAPDRLRQALGQFLRRMSALEPARLDQGSVDTLREAGPARSRWLPRELTRERLEEIQRLLAGSAGPITARDAAAASGISRVTARRYLEYLVTIDEAVCDSIADGPGRPRKTYALRRGRAIGA